MTKQLVVKGHGLLREGRVYSKWYGWVAEGPATCSCGWQSEELTSDAARKRAHREHKLAMIQYDGLGADGTMEP